MMSNAAYRYLFRLLVFILALSLPVISYGGEPFSKYENTVLKNFSRGNDYQLYNSIERLLLEFPCKPESFLYYRDIYRMRDIYGAQHSEKILRKLIRIVQSKKKSAYKNLILLALKLELERLLFPVNRKEADIISAALKPVRQWILLGPYSRYGRADYSYAFFPEISPYIKKQPHPIKNIKLRNATGELDINRFINARKGIAYAISTSRIKGPVKLRIYSDSSYKIFINGKEVCSNSPLSTFRRYRVIRIWGAKYITVMIKIYRESSWRFRAFLTDDTNFPINPEFITGKISISDFRYIEEMDYPFSHLMDSLIPSNSDRYLRIGNYYNELDSPESIHFYRKAAELSTNPAARYLLGSSYIKYSSDDKDSAFYLEGWRILQSLEKTNAGFIPGRYMSFRLLCQNKRYFDAYREGIRIRKDVPRNLGFRSDFLHLLSSIGYEKKFLEEAHALLRDFPHSNTPDLLLGSYYSDRNTAKAENYFRRAISKRAGEKAILSLVNVLRGRGDYQKAINLIGKYNFQDDFQMKLIDLLIENKDYSNARKILLKAIVQNECPEYYLKLGNINYTENSEPSMHWKKLLTTNHSYFALSDFLSYKNHQRLTPPLHEFRLKNIRSQIKQWFAGKSPDAGVHTLYRGRTYLLHHDGSSRAYFEDLLFTGNREGIEKWGKFRIPPGGIVHPLHIRIYKKDGTVIGSHQIEEINGKRYANLSSLENDTVAHIAYVIDMPVTEPGDSIFFSIPITPIHDYNETVQHFALNVITPPDLVVTLYSNRNLPIKRKSRIDGTIVNSLEISSNTLMHRKENSAHRFATLPVYSFSTIPDLKDLVHWYNGLLKGKMEIDTGLTRAFKGKNFNKIIEQVHAYVTHEIDLMGNLLFYPKKAINTIYKKSGSVEDKVILMKALLEEIGIKSYIALTHESDFPKTGGLINPAIFSRILLYIPTTMAKGMWVDFSNKNYSCGVVNQKVIGTRALVLVGNDYEIKTISSEASVDKQVQ